MTGPRVLECAQCGAPVAFRAPACLFCRAPQTWEDAPPRLLRGASVYDARFPRDTVPGANAHPDLVVTSSGARVDVGAGRGKLGIAGRTRRNACVAVTATALSPDVGFGALVRAYRDGPVFGAYLASVMPEYRAVSLSRLLAGGELGAVAELSGWEPCSAMRAPGEPNTVELRCADSVLEVHVNGVRAIALVDAGIGCGDFGWRVHSHGEQGGAILHAVEVFDVVTR